MNKHDDYEKYTSPYLMRGIQQDEFQIKSIDMNLELGQLTANVDITNYFTPSDGSFHLSALTANRISSQLCIIQTFNYLNRPKDAEMYLLSEKWRYRRAITKTQSIHFFLYDFKVTKRGGNTIYTIEVNVENGSFTGKLCGCILTEN